MNFRILGPIEVLDDGGGSLQLGKRKERALLVFLTMHANRTVSADACIEALWPDGAPARADANLHTLIARLRRTLEPDRGAGEPPTRLVRDRSGYRLVAAHHEVDALRFRQAADRGRALLDAGDASGARRHLGAALTEWRGAALGEFAYDPFADRAAEQLEELRVATVEAELGARVAMGEPNVIPELETFVGDHPLREHGWADLMLALYRDGRQTEALRRAEAFRSTLAEVGLDPSPRVRDVAEAILTQDPTLEAPAAVLQTRARRSPEDDQSTRLPRWWQPSDHFVGRNRELDTLRATWFRCRDGAVHAAVIVGEPGIGKSALAIETAERALAGGATVLAGACSATSAVSYLAIGEALGRLVDTLGDSEIEALGDHAPRLTRLLPTAEARLGRPPNGDSGDDEVDRHLLFEAVCTLIGQHSETAPILLVLDDLQWADAGTMHLLDHLLRSDRTGRLLVLATVRREDLAADTTLRTFVDSWVRTSRAITIEMGGLAADEIRELVAAAAPGGPNGTMPVDPELADDLSARSDGNPFFVVEMARHIGSQPRDPDALPATIQALIRSRLDRLDPDHRVVLRVAALQDDRIDLDVLAAVCGEVAAAIDAAVAADILIERRGVLLFRHDLVRAVLEAESGPAQRATWHRALGQAYLDRAGDDPGAIVDQVAGHFVAAAVDGDAAAAVHYAQMAGDHARAALAYENAADQYEAGIRVMRAARPVDSAVATDLQVSLLEAWQLLGEHRRATHELCTHMTGLTRVASIEQLRRLARVCVECAIPMAEDDTATFADELDRIEARFRSEPAPDEQDLALISLARALVSLQRGDVAASLERIDAVLAARSREWRVGLQVLIVDAALFVLAERRPISELVGLIEDVSGIVENHARVRLDRLQGIDVVARWAALTTGDVERALELDDRLARRATELGMPRYLAGMEQRRAAVRLAQGDVAAAEHHAFEAIRYRPDEEFAEGYLAQLAAIRHHQGRVEELVDALEAVDSDSVAAWMAGRAWLLAEVDRQDEARAVLDRFVARLDQWDRDVSWLGALAVAVYAADTMGVTEVVEPLRRALEPHRGRVALTGFNTLILGPVDLLLGALSALEGDVVATRGHLTDAQCVIDVLGAEVFAARASLVRAEVLGRAGDESQRAEMIGHARDALSMMDRLGIRGTLRGRAERLARS